MHKLLASVRPVCESGPDEWVLSCHGAPEVHGARLGSSREEALATFEKLNAERAAAGKKEMSFGGSIKAAPIKVSPRVTGRGTIPAPWMNIDDRKRWSAGR